MKLLSHLEEELDELKSVSTILGGLGKAEKITAQNCLSLQIRMEAALLSIKTKCRGVDSTSSGGLNQAAVKEVLSNRTSVDAAAADALEGSHNLGGSVTSKDGSLPNLVAPSKVSTSRKPSQTGESTPRAPKRSNPQSSGGRKSLSASLEGGVLASGNISPRQQEQSPRQALTARPPTQEGSQSSRSGFQVKKPMSSSVNMRIAALKNVKSSSGAASAVSGGNPDAKECVRVMPAVLHTLLECVANVVECETAHIFLPVRDEMVCCCHVAERPTFPPVTIRHQSAGSLTGGVFSSGVAVSQTTAKGQDDSGKVTNSLLLFPIRGSVSKKTIAVLQLSNKHRGKSAFSACDETMVNSMSYLIGAVMERHAPVNWAQHLFDPVVLHGSGSPFEPFEKFTVLPSKLESAALNVDELDAGVARKGVSTTESFKEHQLIHRSTNPVSLSRRQALAEKALGLSAVPSLLEVDSYMVNLQDCWKRSVQMTVNQAQEDRAKTDQLKQLRDELKRYKKENEHLGEELRLLRLDSDDYKREYSTLRDELDIFLKKRKTGGDDDD